MPHIDRITRVRVCVCAGLTMHVSAWMRVHVSLPSPPPLFHVTSSFHSHSSDYRLAQRSGSSSARSRRSVRLTRSIRALCSGVAQSLHQSGSVGEDECDSCTAICELHLLAQGKEEVNLSFLFKSGKQTTLSTHSILFALSFCCCCCYPFSLCAFSHPVFRLGGKPHCYPKRKGIPGASFSCQAQSFFSLFLSNHGKHKCGDGGEGVRRARWTLPGDCQWHEGGLHPVATSVINMQHPVHSCVCVCFRASLADLHQIPVPHISCTFVHCAGASAHVAVLIKSFDIWWATLVRSLILVDVGLMVTIVTYLKGTTFLYCRLIETTTKRGSIEFPKTIETSAAE